MSLAAMTVIRAVMMIVFVLVLVRMFVAMRMLVFVASLMQVLVRIMEVDVTFTGHLANKIITAEKQKRPARDAREPGADRFA